MLKRFLRLKNLCLLLVTTAPFAFFACTFHETDPRASLGWIAMIAIVFIGNIVSAASPSQ